MAHPDLDSALERRAVALAEQAMGGRVERIERIPAGLGHRHFLRLTLNHGPSRCAVARIDPLEGRPADPEPPLEPIRALLEAEGIPVPRRLAADEAAGIEILEDVGDETLERAAGHAEPAARRALYASALALLPQLQGIGETPERRERIAAFGRRLDAPLIATKARKWVEWTLPELLGRPASPAEIDASHRAFSHAAEVCGTAPSRLAHRDFKAANIHLLGSGASARPVLIDLQGAFMAPPEYDAVCLLRDAHVPLPEAEVAAHNQALPSQLPDAPTQDEYARRFDLITLARVAKDVSHYLHAWRERGDDRYLRFVPNGLRNLRIAAPLAADRDDAVGDFARLVADLPETLPGPRGGSPPCAP